jgi:TetR/AcrR family transcriptional repressor of mexJK operon
MTAPPPRAKTRPKRGRPVDEGKRDQILDAAAKFFMTKGFHATSMEDIAVDAGMSKLTLYRRFPDKNALFTAVIERKCRESLPPDMYARIKGHTLPEIVHAFCRAFFDLLMSDDAINLYRMIMAEAAQNPAVARMFYNAGPVRVKKMVDTIFADFKAKGHFKDVDIEAARHTLLSLFTGSEIYMKRLLNIGPIPSHREREQFTKKTADIFLHMYGHKRTR